MKSQLRDLGCERQAWYPARVKLGQSLNCFFLALFLLGGLFAAFASPARAELGQMHPHGQPVSEATGTMAAGMPCCPTDPDETPGCGEDCTTMRLCQAGCLASGPSKAFSLIVRPIISSLEPTRNDLVSAWRPFEPPARPPRTRGITGA